MIICHVKIIKQNIILLYSIFQNFRINDASEMFKNSLFNVNKCLYKFGDICDIIYMYQSFIYLFFLIKTVDFYFKHWNIFIPNVVLILH